MRDDPGAGGSEGSRRIWDPEQYLRFGDLRLRPALELLSRVGHTSPLIVHDLGCGTGEVTRIMAERWPNAEVTGSDKSPAMLARASETPGRIRWQELDLLEWAPDAPQDVIFSNAVLHWVTDHDRLLPRLAGFLADDGVLALQMPLSWEEPSHVLMREVLTSGGEAGGPLGSNELRSLYSARPVAPPASYYDVLAPHVDGIDIWTTTYLQVLEGTDPVLEWVKGTGLRPILEGLPAIELSRFLSVYTEKLREAYPTRTDGTTLYPFPRMFIVATR